MIQPRNANRNIQDFYLLIPLESSYFYLRKNDYIENRKDLELMNRTEQGKIDDFLGSYVGLG